MCTRPARSRLRRAGAWSPRRSSSGGCGEPCWCSLLVPRPRPVALDTHQDPRIRWDGLLSLMLTFQGERFLERVLAWPKAVTALACGSIARSPFERLEGNSTFVLRPGCCSSNRTSDHVGTGLGWTQNFLRILIRAAAPAFGFRNRGLALARASGVPPSRRGHGVQRAACSPFFKRGCRASCRRLAASTPRPPTAPLDKPTPLRRCRVSCRVSAAGSARMHTHHTARSTQHASRVTQRTPGPRDSSEAPATSLGRLQSHGVKLCSPRPRDRGRRSRSAPRTLPCPGRYIPKPSLRS